VVDHPGDATRRNYGGDLVAGELSKHAALNRAHWDGMADEWVAMGERAWVREPSWGVWSIPDTEVGLLPDDMTGLDAIELGCGTGYVSAWMTRRGARTVGIDVSERQLDTARRLAAEHGIDIEFVHGTAEQVERPDGSFDFAISEYGAAIWCDPYVWIPEAHRLLRPGGTLVSLGNSPLLMLCCPVDGSLPVTRRLERPYFGMYRFDWTDAIDEPGGIEFNLPISDWFALFKRAGFDVVDYHELRAPSPDLPDSYVPAAWSYDFPCEQVWVVRKR
jgi:SAM-dependent methyltransferase